MRRSAFRGGRGSLVSVVGVALGALGAFACSPKTGSNAPFIPPPPPSAVDAGHGHADARPMIVGVKPPPDATIIHPGEGGIRTGDLGAAKKIDIVFMVDDSISMEDKHDVLKAAVPDLLNRFVNPVCLDRFGKTSQPSSADLPCPDEMNRQFAPVRDIHIGVITSSLGTVDTPNTLCTSTLGKGNDMGHFLGSLERAATIPTSPFGFLAWDPDQKATPPGQKDLGQLITSFQNLVGAIGETGCGLEQQLEAWYRLLVDPEPRLATKLAPCATNPTSMCFGPDGVDQTVLDQRAAFLRPDSLVIIVMLTDENDCSMTDTAAQLLHSSAVNPPQGSAACATNPDDPCCYPCISPAPSGCPNPDPVCAMGTTFRDQVNLRCYEGKRRYGFDPLRPVQRYIDGLTKTMVPSRSGAMVQNPLFVGSRTPSQVFLVGILGVPWQDVATDDSLKSPTDLHLRSARELRDNGRWDLIVGDPATRRAPTDPLMLESVLPRTGTSPVTGVALAPPSAMVMANPVNGHERFLETNPDDLQYSCIFPLPQVRDCTLAASGNCECRSPSSGEMSPLCQDPGGNYTTIQRYAKAYPPSRVLQVLKGIGDAGVVASICPRT
jgi:hypothetical protein